MVIERSNTSANCLCGRSHTILTQDILISNGAIKALPKLIEKYQLPRDVMLVYDTNTYAVAGHLVGSILIEAGYEVREQIFDAKQLIHPDEPAVGELMFAMEPEPHMLIAVGSGTLNDLCRFCANRIKIPYMVVATAPSMDGYASTVTPITYQGMKISYIGIHPEVIIGDTSVSKSAPLTMIAAGFGDIFGKVTAHMDWRLSHIMTGEVMCDKVLDVASSAVDKCLQTAANLKDRTDDAIKGLMDALVLSGIAMQMQGNSRPASGAEHHLAHYLEMQDTLEREGAFHGTHVGIATLIIMRLYEKFFEGEPPLQGTVTNSEAYEVQLKKVYGKLSTPIMNRLEGHYFMQQDEWEEQKERLLSNWDGLKVEVSNFQSYRKEAIKVLEALDSPYKPQHLGYSREEMKDALLYCRLIRDRFTLLTVLDNWGILDSYVEEVLDEIYE